MWVGQAHPTPAGPSGSRREFVKIGAECQVQVPPIGGGLAVLNTVASRRCLHARMGLA
jgi:hypothetical protein